jgi:TM2 domain-containing membrane protein YozV
VETSNISPKSRLVALLLCFFLGMLGVHRFYVGKIGTGILMILTFGGLGIWALIDLIIIVVGSFKDKEGRRVFRWTEPGSV